MTKEQIRRLRKLKKYFEDGREKREEGEPVVLQYFSEEQLNFFKQLIRRSHEVGSVLGSYSNTGLYTNLLEEVQTLQAKAEEGVKKGEQLEKECEEELLKAKGKVEKVFYFVSGAVVAVLGGSYYFYKYSQIEPPTTKPVLVSGKELLGLTVFGKSIKIISSKE